MKAKPKQLGDLGVSEYFTRGRGKTIYRTITYVGKWNAQTKRDCLNMTTLKAEYLSCSLEVFNVEHNIESSKDTEN